MKVERIRASARDGRAGALTDEAGGLRGKQARSCQVGTLCWEHWGAVEG